MGFMDGLVRIFQGRPPEEILPDEIIPSDSPEEGELQQQDQPEPAPEEQAQPQPQEPPIIQIVRTICNLKGPNIEVYGFVHNNSQVLIQVDKIRLLGGMRELNFFLKPGEQKEVLLYQGANLRDNSNHTAELIYKDLEGTYFCSMHLIEFIEQADKTYAVHQLKLQMPIRTNIT